MGHSTVKKRCVFALTGYEPVAPGRQHERFVRELRRFERTWSVRAEASAMALSREGAVASWRVTTRGPNWSVDTEYRSLRWDDLVAADFGRSDWERVPRALAAFADFIISGTALRYFRANWRYGLFFLYPLLILGVFVALSLWIAAMAVGWIGVPQPWSLAAIAGGGFVLFALLLRFAGPPLMLAYILDDWIFAHQFVHRSRPGFAERLEAFAQDVAAKLRANDVDEIVVSGHSLGAAIKLAVVDRALQLVPEFGAKGERLCLLSTGSSLLKVALHPQATWLAEAVLRVARHPAIFWIEYQALVDVISFYKTNPVAALTHAPSDTPLLRKLRIRHMLDDAAYRRFRGNFFRLHRQLVMGNDKRYFYDFFMVCCGPFSLPARAADPEAMLSSFAADGRLVDPAPLDTVPAEGQAR
jgi:pimeloyl-ACP methyl ester carboxylesterase